MGIAMVAATVFFLMEPMNVGYHWKTSMNVGALVHRILPGHLAISQERHQGEAQQGCFARMRPQVSRMPSEAGKLARRYKHGEIDRRRKWSPREHRRLAASFVK